MVNKHMKRWSASLASSSLVSPALAGGFFTTEPSGKPLLDLAAAAKSL